MLDARLIRNAFRQLSEWPTTLTLAEDGEEAMSLFGREIESPDLVILDFNLPKYDGAQVLQFIRSKAALQNMPVFIFSSSPVDLVQERMSAAKVRADAYFEKPGQAGTFLDIARKMRDCFLQVRESGNNAATA